jgi:ubiquitin carboxyl-terminal hydrolase MINDY-3/4
VKQQLDSESLGIITQTAFLNEFYPDQSNSTSNKFKIYHYNGLIRSNKNNQIEYVAGEAELIDFCDQESTGLNSIKSCLQTKWPTMEIKWQNGYTPSLN